MSDAYVPVFVKVDNLKLIVFGGGPVALRKCRYFEKAAITVMAREVMPELRKIADKVIIGDIPEDVRDIIDSYDMVIAATDDKALNSRIRDDAMFMGMEVNSAHGGGNILIPSVLKRDKYTVAVSSQGRVPAFPPYVVEELDSFLGERFDRMLDLMIEMRRTGLERIPDQKRRRELLQSVINDPDIQKAVAENRMGDAKELAIKKGY